MAVGSAVLMEAVEATNHPKSLSEDLSPTQINRNKMAYKVKYVIFLPLNKTLNIESNLYSLRIIRHKKYREEEVCLRYIRFLFLTCMVIIIEYLITLFISQKFDLRLIDAFFFVSVFFAVTTLYFSSAGGMFENKSEAEIATSYQGLRSNHKFQRTIGFLYVNFINVGSVLYLIIGFIVAYLYY